MPPITLNQIIAIIAIAVIFAAVMACIDSKSRYEKRRAEEAARNKQDALDRAYNLNRNTKWSD